MKNNLKKKKYKKITTLKPAKLIDTENRLVAARNGGWVKCVKGVQRHKLSVIKCHENAVHSMVIAANVTVLHK